MKKIIYTLFLSLAFTFVNAQSIPNGSFESWTTASPALPQNWKLSGLFAKLNSLTVNSETRLPTDQQTFLGLGNALINGVGVLGQINQKFPLTSRPKSIRFDCMYFPSSTVAGQFASAQIIMTKKNGASIDTIANGTFALNGALIINWASVAVDLDPIYKVGVSSNPDSCFIRFMLNPNSASQISVNSIMLTLDAAKFSTNAASVEESLANMERPTQLSIFPNPAKEATSIKFKMICSSKVALDIVDLNGRIVKHLDPSDTFSGINELPLDISNLDNGLYIVKLTSENGVNSTKLVVSK